MNGPQIYMSCPQNPTGKPWHFYNWTNVHPAQKKTQDTIHTCMSVIMPRCTGLEVKWHLFLSSLNTFKGIQTSSQVSTPRSTTCFASLPSHLDWSTSGRWPGITLRAYVSTWGFSVAELESLSHLLHHCNHGFLFSHPFCCISNHIAIIWSLGSPPSLTSNWLCPWCSGMIHLAFQPHLVHLDQIMYLDVTPQQQ
jgi:hypothetical protein